MMAGAVNAPVTEQLPSVVESVNVATAPYGVAPVEAEQVHKIQCAEAEMSGFDASAFTDLGHCLMGIAGAVADNSAFSFEGLAGETANAMCASISAAGQLCLNHADAAQTSGKSVDDCGAAVGDIVAAAQTTASGIFTALQQPVQVALALCPINGVGPLAAQAAKSMCEVLIGCLNGVFEARNSAVAQCYEQVCHDVEQTPEDCAQTSDGEANPQPPSLPAAAPSVPSTLTAPVATMSSESPASDAVSPAPQSAPPAGTTECHSSEGATLPAATNIQTSAGTKTQFAGSAGASLGGVIGAAVGEFVGGAVGGAIEGTATALLNFDLPGCEGDSACTPECEPVTPVCESTKPECEPTTPQSESASPSSPPCSEESPKHTAPQPEAPDSGTLPTEQVDLSTVPEPAPPAEKLGHLDSSTYSLPDETPPFEQPQQATDAATEVGERGASPNVAAPTETEHAPGPTPGNHPNAQSEEPAATVQVPSAGEW